VFEMSKAKGITYADALGELENIVAALQSETVDVDELSDKVKRALELIQTCNAKIQATEIEVKKILETFDGDLPEPAAA
jgi:exodeoxyribonuclease VII small subunit